MPTGTPLGDPPLIQMISSDPVLKDTKLIAEAWDCDGLNQARRAAPRRRSARRADGGLSARARTLERRLPPGTRPTPPHLAPLTHTLPHPPPCRQVGAFPHYGRWSEWNGHFRDTVRQFVKGTDGPWVGNLASVLCGSPHVYVAAPGEQDWCV